PALRDTVVAFITAADIGVIGVRPVAVELDLKMLAPLLGDEAVKTLSAHMDGPGAPYELRLRHGSSESSWELPPEMESRGTNILLRRLEDLLQVLRDGGVLVLDELDTSLHPDLCGTLVDMFTTPATNPKGAQLVFTTHDGGLLSRLRRDEVVLIDKARDGASTLRTASDYSDVRGRDDLARAYALGRIRGVPALGDLAGILARGLH
ncbi:MAG TPA: AAA family ATPase, partial [Nannocystis sp.]